MSTLPYISRQARYTVAAGAHGATPRLTYTVPAGRRAVVEIVDLGLIETAAIAALAASLSYVEVNAVVIARIANNNVASFKYDTLATHITLNENETIIFYSVNTGAVANTYTGGYKLREYQ